MAGIMKYINRISRNCEMVYNHQLRNYGISQSHHPYILLICKEGGISQEKIAKEIGVNRSNVTRQLSILEEKGLIIRKQDEEDRRIWRVYPTPQMEELLPAVCSCMHTWNEQILVDLDENEREVLLTMLKKVAERSNKVREGE